MAAVAVGLALRRPGDKLDVRRMTAMMIRINLLPVRQVKKREIGRQFLVVVGGALCRHALLGNWLWYDEPASERDEERRSASPTPRRASPSWRR